MQNGWFFTFFLLLWIIKTHAVNYQQVICKASETTMKEKLKSTTKYDRIHILILTQYFNHVSTTLNIFK